jgi:hypothetical protein
MEDPVGEGLSVKTDNDPDDIKLKNTAKLKIVNKMSLH